ncbi:LysR family transcriptional regulator [Lapidilactobacillus mulanensis]|uniref:LysR family transcriptional regulator n=1 Tax=Lapidilactobacillus mulanensis TaxID=2485999 RepID=A0ABW4DIT1_9LACO|nr:LysR family transcriptional regulator [Lapidilactobacillus mulanensis]
MKLQDLFYFDKLVELKSYSGVAKHFDVSQPTISYAIKRLEEEFDVALVNRDVYQQISITPAGQQFDRHIKIVINELNIAQMDLAASQEKVINFGLPPIIANYFFLQFVDQLVKADLLNNLKTTEGGSKALLPELENGHLDMALLGSLAPLQSEKLQATILARHHFKIITAENSPLATKKTANFRDLKNEPFIILTDGFIHRQIFDLLSAANQVFPLIIYQATDVELLKRLVGQGMGVGILTETAILPTDHLHVIDLIDDNLPDFIISLVYRNSTLLTPHQQQLISILRGN